MKTIVYPDGSIEATVRADEFVAAGKARFATKQECASYETRFARDDARIASLAQTDTTPSNKQIFTRMGSVVEILSGDEKTGWVKCRRQSDNVIREYHISDLRADGGLQQIVETILTATKRQGRPVE